MHTTTSYEGLSDIEKHNKAIEDVKEWFGPKFDWIVEEFRKKGLTLEQFTMYMSLGGVEGYPVKAFYNYVYPL